MLQTCDQRVASPEFWRDGEKMEGEWKSGDGSGGSGRCNVIQDIN